MNATSPEGLRPPEREKDPMPSPVILLADDEVHITCVVSQRLSTAGYTVSAARDGEEAFELACKLRPDLIITDLQMPRLSGLELAVRLKRTPQTAATPLVMLTARGYILDEATLSQTNIRRVLPKPFSARDVLSLVTELAGPAQRAEAA
jgi:CheY-like chemotaxis protein